MCFDVASKCERSYWNWMKAAVSWSFSVFQHLRAWIGIGESWSINLVTVLSASWSIESVIFNITEHGIQSIMEH